ncbi:YlxR family protein [Rhodococcus sp. NPDC019627]|uniref:YlxR family protein n=1 Tax=unclassified Rhodococcus (in: high G+C Gram-positive bacteria) TaxID=192944 RepID=UPI003405E54F
MVQHELPDFTRVSAGSPVRTCIGCRERALALDLLRVVVSESGPQGHILVPDPRRRLPGRGAWLHPDQACLSLAERRRAFGRALRVAGSVDTSEIEHWVRAERTRRAVPLEQNRHKHS